MQKQIKPNIKAYLSRDAFYLLLFVGLFVIPFALAERNVIKPDAPTKLSQRTLTFVERVMYQRVVEDVYWRHRIWPKERLDPKPSLDAIMPQAQLEKKVSDYLRKSQALADYGQRPITAELLQVEMDRMARQTRQPDVLRELFEALGNDPFVIAECLARPALAERLLAHSRVEQPKQTSQTDGRIAFGTVNYTLPIISDLPGGCIEDTWTPTSTANAPTARSFHTAIWTGSEMIIWGGQDNHSIFLTPEGNITLARTVGHQRA